ncbi:Vacuolar protein sorting-associated protein 16 [Coemansia guatemalensis]|uniref:Probable vacuolar protein sorting-associated protein 16 homolog n=1 Tax=Coemansia guatemalensis TaxID=2761395 RepID=A0A9W8I0U0_9FUNG|nr:Vacuolar protein sorting-associated protein 16 [Coemansia guatemalensis]
MAMLHPTNEWHALQDTFYRKHRLYQMQWSELDLSKFRIAASSFGGPIALVRDERQLLEAGAMPVLDTAIHVYSASGHVIGRIEYEGPHIAGLCWTSSEDEQLLCVQEDGNVRVFSLSGREPVSFSLGVEAKEKGIIDCRFWDQGLVAMTSEFRLIYIADINEPKPRMLANPGISEPPHCWAVVPPQVTLSRHVEVLMAVGQTILAVDAAGMQDQLLEQGPYACISISPNGRLAALCSSAGRVQVVSIDFQRSFSELDRSNADTAEQQEMLVPLDMAWCGSDAVLANFGTEAVLVGPFGDSLSFVYDAPVHLVQELDGVRIFNASIHEFVSRVGEDSRHVFQIGSTAPAALLYDASDGLLHAHSARADEIVRSIGDEMAAAVDTCIAAAGAEPVVEFQQQLLRAASLGKSFLTTFNGDKLVDMCRSLRIVNNLGAYAVGLPVSLVQFQSLPLEQWVARLLNRNLHRLALQLCTYAEAPADQVYVHWACAKIRASTLDDDALYRVLSDKLQTHSLSSYVDVAEVANRCGYRRLAIRLLQHEPRAASQVPLLISMGQDEAAMDAAVRSGDADLVYFVIFHLFKALSLADFFHAIARTPVAARLFEKYCMETGSPVLEDYYFQDDAFAESARLIIIDNLQQDDAARLLANLKVALKILHNDKTAVRETRAMETQIKLVEIQRQLDHNRDSSTPVESFVGLTLNQTISRCLREGNYTRANKLRGDFNVPEVRYYWIKLRALVQRRDWSELARLASARKSPIGYRPFVDECVAALQFQEAARYIPKCDQRERAMLFLRIGFFREAAEAAMLSRDVDALRQIHDAAREPTLQHEIAQQIERLVSS